MPPHRNERMRDGECHRPRRIIEVHVRANVHLDDPARPVTFAIAHPLVSVRGHANTGGEISAALTLIAPALKPFAAIAGIDLKGQTTINASVATHGQVTNLDVNGTVGVTGGMAPVPELIGSAAKIDVSVAIQDQKVTIK